MRRERRVIISLAYSIAAFTVGTEGLPPLSELLDTEGGEPVSSEMFHERMKALGLE